MRLADVGAAATVLSAPQEHTWATYELCGTDTLTGHDIAEVLTDVGGTPVRAEQVPVEAVLPAGAPDYTIGGFTRLVNHYDRYGILGNPKRLLDLADTATKAVTADSDLGSVNSLMSFAGGLRGIGASHLKMVTMPVRYDPANPNRVIVAEAKAKVVWNALKNDRPIPASATKGTATGAAKGVVTSS